MIETQLWTDIDTHPGYIFHQEWQSFEPDENGVRPERSFVRCFEGWKDGVPLENPDEVHALVKAENNLKNVALGVICDALPQSMKKEVFDEDGDPTGEWVVKAKHYPVWIMGAVDGVVTFSVPGIDAVATVLVEAAIARFNGSVTLG